jgi:hypothetical protein
MTYWLVFVLGIVVGATGARAVYSVTEIVDFFGSQQR